jgi:SAM-dependent methyltransferase
MGVPFTLSMCVMEDNCSEMAEIVDFAAEVGAANVHYLWYFVRGRGGDAGLVDPAAIFEQLEKAAASAQRRDITIDNIEAFRAQVFSPSGTLRDGGNSGWESVTVGPDDRLYPSPALVGVPSLGTPLGRDLALAWRQSPVLEDLRRSTAADQTSPLRFLVGGGDHDHSFVHGGRFLGDDPYLPLYEKIALWLITSEAARQRDDGPPGLRLKMGEVLERCGDAGEVALVHSNCLLALASTDHVGIVSEFYTRASESPKEEIANPVHYPEALTDHVPPDCMVRSYGCGSPVLDAAIQPGETVVDLGSGTGVECLIAAKIVGPEGRVVGIDMLEPMLDLARKGAESARARLGYGNVEFTKAYLESLPLDDESADVVLSNCVLNLSRHKRRTFGEIFRVLKEGGRLVVSDVVCENEPPSAIRNDDTLRGECIAGALTQRDLVGLLEESGFASVRILKRFPYRVVRDHPFFSLTFEARRASRTRVKQLIYRGPFAAVLTMEGDLITPGSTCCVAVPEHLADPGQVFELDPTGTIANADVGSSACCVVAPPDESGAAGCCGATPERLSREQPGPASQHRQGCMTCGAPLVYANEETEVSCELCGDRLLSSVRCEGGHFVCDDCHTEDGLQVIESGCLRAVATDMISLFRRIRAHPSIRMHGPEHHALVPGVILATYRNLGGDLSDDKIRSGIRRGAKMPGGACGFMGVCGAAVGVGIAFGVILESNPVTPVARRIAQSVTSEVLAEIATLEAARCCQRECWVAFRKAAELSGTLLRVTLRADDPGVCDQVHSNAECAGPSCPLYDSSAKLVKTDAR